MGRRVKLKTVINEMQKAENRRLRYGKTAAPKQEEQALSFAKFEMIVGLIALPIFIATLCTAPKYANNPFFVLIIGVCIITGVLVFVGIYGIFSSKKTLREREERLIKEKEVLKCVNQHIQNFDTQILNANDRNSIKQAIFVALTSIGMTVVYPERGKSFGVDMVAYSSHCKICVKIVNAQSPVGISSINQGVVGYRNYHCSELWIYSVNQQFTLNAIKEEKIHSYIKLMNKHELISNLNRVMRMNHRGNMSQ